MSFGELSTSGFISLAIVTSTQLTLAEVAVSATRLAVLQSAKLLIAGCHLTHRLGSASRVVSLGPNDGDSGSESFAIVCQPKNKDVSYAPSVHGVLGDRADPFSQHTAIAKHAGSIFSPSATNRKVEGVNTLIEDTIAATVKELRKTHLDEAVRAEEEATKVVTPEMIKKKNDKITEVTTEGLARQDDLVDATASMLSPLMGITLSGGNESPSEPTVMDSLLSIQSDTPKVGRLASPDDMFPNHTAHMILARVEHGGGAREIKITPAAMPFPYQMARLDVLTLHPLTRLPLGPPKTPSPYAGVSFDDLMFSPSPGKMMSPALDKEISEGKRFSIVCKTADSQQLYFFVVSASDASTLTVESETHIDLDRILAQSLDVPIQKFSIKSIVIDKASTQWQAGRVECSSRMRLVLSIDANNAGESNTLSAGSKPINLTLEEDGSIFILLLSCTLPLASDELSLIQKSQETPYEYQRDGGDTRKQNSALESALQTILERLTAFEKDMARRMDAMENAIKENTDRVGALEAALLKE